jgi:hypothetical protein
MSRLIELGPAARPLTCGGPDSLRRRPAGCLTEVGPRWPFSVVSHRSWPARAILFWRPAIVRQQMSPGGRCGISPTSPGPREHRTAAVGSGASAALVVLGQRRDGPSCHEQRAGLQPSRHQGGASDQEPPAGGGRPGRRATLAATAPTSRPGVAVSGHEVLTETRRPAAVSPRRWSAGRGRVQARRAQDPQDPAVACGRSGRFPPTDSTRLLIVGQPVPAPGSASAGMAGRL